MCAPHPDANDMLAGAARMQRVKSTEVAWQAGRATPADSVAGSPSLSVESFLASLASLASLACVSMSTRELRSYSTARCARKPAGHSGQESISAGLSRAGCRLDYRACVHMLAGGVLRRRSCAAERWLQDKVPAPHLAAPRAPSPEPGAPRSAALARLRSGTAAVISAGWGVTLVSWLSCS